MSELSVHVMNMEGIQTLTVEDRAGMTVIQKPKERIYDKYAALVEPGTETVIIDDEDDWLDRSEDR